MGGHAEALSDGLEVLFLLVNAGALAPPPGLVNERAVRGIHEADDAVVHVAGQVGGEGCAAEAGAEFGQFGRGRLLDLFSAAGSGTHTSGSGFGNVDPGIAVALFAGERGGVDVGGVGGVGG